MALDPGNLRTNLQRSFGTEVSRVGAAILNLFLHPPVKGAYTELFAGVSPDVTPQNTIDPATWVLPWGRLATMKRLDLVDAFNPENNGKAAEFWTWCERQVEEYIMEAEVAKN